MKSKFTACFGALNIAKSKIARHFPGCYGVVYSLRFRLLTFLSLLFLSPKHILFNGVLCKFLDSIQSLVLMPL